MSPASALPRPRIVACPTCGGNSVYASDNPFRPFCSERCKNVDFGAWAAESYRLEARPAPPDSADSTDSDAGESIPRDPSGS